MTVRGAIAHEGDVVSIALGMPSVVRRGFAAPIYVVPIVSMPANSSAPPGDLVVLVVETLGMFPDGVSTVIASVGVPGGIHAVMGMILAVGVVMWWV